MLSVCAAVMLSVCVAADSAAMPIYMHYRWVQWQAHNLGWTEEQEEAAYEELHNRCVHPGHTRTTRRC